MVAGIASAFSKIITPDNKVTDQAPVDLAAPELTKAPVVLSEVIGEPKPVAPVVEPPKPAAVVPPVAPVVAPETKKVVVKPPTPVVPTEPVVVAPVVAPVVVPPVADPDAAFVETLNDAQRDELEVARYAETKYPELKGRAQATIDFYKKLDAFVKDNKDAAPDSDEFKEFVEANKPKYNEGQRRKIERQMIADQAAAQAKRDFDGQFKKQEEELHALRVKPEVEAASQGFRKTMETVELPEGVDPTVRDVAAKLNKDGYDAAAKDFSLEAPIVQSHLTAADKYVAISRGAEKFNPADPTHKWLDGFVSRQATTLAQRPEAERMVNGKLFLTPADYAAKRNADPNGAAEKFWTFSEQQILNMIAVNAALQINGEIQRLEQAGFKRAKKSDKVENPPVTTPPIATTEPVSPRAGASQTPGPVVPTTAANPEASFLNSLVPGAAERLLK